jgi:hypothetical protein
MMSYTRNVMVPCLYATLGGVAGRPRTDSTREVDLIVTLDRPSGNTSGALSYGFFGIGRVIEDVTKREVLQS